MANRDPNCQSRASVIANTIQVGRWTNVGKLCLVNIYKYLERDRMLGSVKGLKASISWADGVRSRR